MAKILIVDDKPVNRQLLKEILKYDHEVLEAGDGAEALELARREHPGLIITDILMPTMDGYELVRQLRGDHTIPHCPVVFYTAYYHEKEMRSLAELSGISRVLYKPCEPQTVLQVVGEVLELEGSLARPAPAHPLQDQEFKSAHQRLLTNKLARKADELELANAQLNALVEFGLELASELDPERVLQTACRAARGMVGGKSAVLGILDQELRRVQQLAFDGAASRAGAEQLFLRLHRSVLAADLAQRRPRRLAHPTNLLQDDPPVRSLLALPLFTPNRTYGWLLLLNRGGQEEFSAESERLCAMIAAKVAAAYENRIYFAEMQRHAGELEREVQERKQAEQQLRAAHDLLELRVQERTRELERTVLSLQGEVAERQKALEEVRRKDELLIQQGRLAAMGEMIGNIAHQWRQPLNNLGLVVQQLAFHAELGEMDRGLVLGSTDKAMELIQHMSQTINDFRDFFRPDKEKVPFEIGVALHKTLSLIEGSFALYHVAVELEVPEATYAYGYPNEFSQVLLNIFSNARDAFAQAKVAVPRLRVEVRAEAEQVVLTITDNAGGIEHQLLGRIFEPYVSTKGVQGTGIGLYMAKIIIENNMHGSITARNLDQGAQFQLRIPRK